MRGPYLVCEVLAGEEQVKAVVEILSCCNGLPRAIHYTFQHRPLRRV